MSDDIDAFLDGEEPKPEPKEQEKPKRRRGRPPKKKEAETDAAKEYALGAESITIKRLRQPVSVTFLSQVFGMDRKTIDKKLAPLPPVGTARGHTPLYDFRQAMEYLVRPRGDIEQHIKKMGVDDLPASLQKDVWDARLKAQKWAVQAGELWKTEDVLEVLSEAFSRLKTTQQLWIDQLTDSHSLTPELREELTRLMDGLQADQHRALVDLPKERATKSQLGDIDEEEVP